MSMFDWKNDYSVGYIEIDTQHKRLFQLAQELHDAMAKGHGKDALSRTLSNLVAYTKQHFACEEKLMQTHRYPDYHAHKAQHDALTQQVVQFQKDFEAGHGTVTIDLMTFLRDWLSHHIGQTDRNVAAFLKQKSA